MVERNGAARSYSSGEIRVVCDRSDTEYLVTDRVLAVTCHTDARNNDTSVPYYERAENTNRTFFIVIEILANLFRG